MLRGYALAILLLVGARAIAAQQPASPASAQTTAQAPSTSPQSPCQPSPPPAPQQTPPPGAWHCITVTFDYDFNKTPPCSTSRPVHPCVAQFAIFETTAGFGEGQRIPLFNVPLPPNPRGVVRGITQQSPKQYDLVPGWHKLCVAALDPSGSASTLRWCLSCGTWIWVQTGPTPTPSTPVSCTSTPPPPTPPPTPTP